MTNLLVISSAPLIDVNGKYFAYSPYIKEIEIWNKHSSSIAFCCPFWYEKRNLLVFEIPFVVNKIFKLQDFNIKNLKNAIYAIPIILKSLLTIYKSIKSANHIHIRCPGNFGLLACIVQIFFPNKIKTAKYAGNWDPKAKKPTSYKLQKWILSNTFLTKNMQVLVYGEWQNQSKNIKPFFTATYKETEKTDIVTKSFKNNIEFLFVGMLTKGKNPMYCIQILEKLLTNHKNIKLSYYGEGIERENLENYIKINNLQNFVSLKGNHNLEILKKAYQESHFMILPSESEGWPKAVAEAMFWGCLPISTPVSCVSNMLDNENRGILLEMNLDQDIARIEKLLNNEIQYQEKVLKAINWSRKYTLDYFAQEIKLLLQS